jgi:hypothetical protein
MTHPVIDPTFYRTAAKAAAAPGEGTIRVRTPFAADPTGSSLPAWGGPEGNDDGPGGIALRSLALARVYLSSMDRSFQPATAISPPSKPPWRNQRVAAVWRCGASGEGRTAPHGALGSPLKGLAQSVVAERSC